MNGEKSPALLVEAKRARETKIESIFLPHASRQRDKIYESGKNLTARFVHYTSAEAAIKIINQKRLWLRNAACMTDYREVQHGFSILHKFFSDNSKTNRFVSAVNNFAPGAVEEAVKNFDEWWKLGTIQFKTFIASVSEHDFEEDYHGRLSMWRAFGGTSTRVGLVFNIPWHSDAGDHLKLSFSPVSYFKDNEAEQFMFEVVGNIEANLDFLKTLERWEVIRWIFTMLLLGVTCVKHEGFREEKEWRAVHCPQISTSPLMKPSTEIIGGVPQIVYQLPLDKSIDPILSDLDFAKIFDRIIIGPSPYPITMFDAYLEALSNAGVPDAGSKIFISGIPIRS